MAVMFDIFVRVLLPVLALVGLGAAVQRWKAIDVKTLVALNLYVFVPCFLFVRVSHSDLSWTDIGMIGGAVFIPMLLMGGTLFGVMRGLRIEGGTTATVLVGGLVFNAGNFGIPVAQLAFGDEGGQVQALIVMFVNTAVFFLGYAVLSLPQGGGIGQALLGYFKLPMIYAIGAGLLVRELGTQPPPGLAWLDQSMSLAADGMVSIALITLGAQLAKEPRWPKWRMIGPIVIIKLIAVPAGTGLVVWMMGLWPWPGAQLVLAAAGPTAINTLLLTIELDGDADSMADAVFWTTLACALTVTVTLGILHLIGGDTLPWMGS